MSKPLPLSQQRVCANCSHAEGYHNPPLPPDFPYHVLSHICFGHSNRVMFTENGPYHHLPIADKVKFALTCQAHYDKHHATKRTTRRMDIAPNVLLQVCNCCEFVPLWEDSLEEEDRL